MKSILTALCVILVSSLFASTPSQAAFVSCLKTSFEIPPGAPTPTLRCAIAWAESDEDPYDKVILQTTFIGPGPGGTTASGTDNWAIDVADPAFSTNIARHNWVWTVAGIHTGAAVGNQYYAFLNTEGVPYWEFIQLHGTALNDSTTANLP